MSSKSRDPVDLREREQSFGHVGVVLKHTCGLTDHAIARHSAQTSINKMDVDQQPSRVTRSVDEVGASEERARLGKCRNRQAVPCGDDLVVSPG